MFHGRGYSARCFLEVEWSLLSGQRVPHLEGASTARPGTPGGNRSTTRSQLLNEVVGVGQLGFTCCIQPLHLFGRKFPANGLEVRVQLFDVPGTNDWCGDAGFA